MTPEDYVETIPQTTNDFALFKELFYQLIVDNQYTRVLETGTDVGDSARIFSTALQATQGTLVSIDIKPPVGDWLKDWPVKNIQFVLGDSRHIQLTEELDLLFLDAHHEGTNAYEQVKTELIRLGTWVRLGGKIVVDDFYHNEFGQGIRHAIEEFAQQFQLIFTVYPQSHGLALIDVSHQLPHPSYVAP